MTTIYKISSPSGKIYIGQTYNVRARFSQYRRGWCKEQTILHNSFLKYGFERHQFEIVHELPEDIDKETVDRYESLYIELYKDAGFKMMNLTTGGKGGKLSESTCQKISSSLVGNTNAKGFKHTEETKKRINAASAIRASKSVIQFNHKGQIVSEHPSIKSAAKAIGLHKSTIERALHGKLKTAGGYVWRFKR